MRTLWHTQLSTISRSVVMLLLSSHIVYIHYMIVVKLSTQHVRRPRKPRDGASPLTSPPVLQHSRPKCYSVGSAWLFRMLRAGKMRSTFRHIQDGSLAAYTRSTAGPWLVPRRSTA